MIMITKEDMENIKSKIIHRLKSMGYTIKLIAQGWYDEETDEPVDWEDDREEPDNDWFYVEEDYYRCKNDTNQVAFSWRIDDYSKTFEIVGLWGKFKNSTKGFATKTIDETLKLIPEDYIIEIENSINNGYWDRIRDKYPQYNWNYVYENLNEASSYNKLYHRTSIKNAINIIKENTLKVGGNYWYNIKNNIKCVCFSRDYNFIKTMPGEHYVVFVLNKDKLSSRHKLMPISDDKNRVNGPGRARYMETSKAEEICMEDIKNISNYIDEILVSKDAYDTFVDAIGKTNIKVTKLDESLNERLYDNSLYKLAESLLLEKNRQDLLNKSKYADNYKDTSKGKNRYERRKRSKIATTIKDYNSISMDALFKTDIIEFNIKVQGETDNYVVTILLDQVLEDIQKQLKANNYKFEFKVILQSLLKNINSNNIYVSCSCPDFKFSQAYWASKENYNSGTPQFDNGKGIRNPNNTKGAGCKHILLCLANLDWVMKIASVIYNYIKYCKDNLKKSYEKYIYPAIYGKKYDPENDLSMDKETGNERDITNKAIGKALSGRDVRGRFTKKDLKDADKVDISKSKFNKEDDKSEE